MQFVSIFLIGSKIEDRQLFDLNFWFIDCLTDWQTNKQTNIKTEKSTKMVDKMKYKQTQKQTSKKIKRPIDWQTERLLEKYTLRLANKQTLRLEDKHTDRHTSTLKKKLTLKSFTMSLYPIWKSLENKLIILNKKSGSYIYNQNRVLSHVLLVEHSLPPSLFILFLSYHNPFF